MGRRRWIYPLVAVQWEDAHGAGNTQYELSEIPHAPVVPTTYGLLLREDEAGITLANEHYDDMSQTTTFRGITFIPRKMILNVEVIKGVRKVGLTKTDGGQSLPESPVSSTIPTTEEAGALDHTKLSFPPALPS